MEQAQILIVDDLPDVSSTFKGLLLELGYSCDVASSKQKAIEMLSKHDYKLATLDIRLDDTDENNQDGIEIVNWLTANQSHTKAIVITGYADVKYVRLALSSGIVSDFCEKQEIEKFIESVTKVMESL